MRMEGIETSSGVEEPGSMASIQLSIGREYSPYRLLEYGQDRRQPVDGKKDARCRNMDLDRQEKFLSISHPGSIIQSALGRTGKGQGASAPKYLRPGALALLRDTSFTGRPLHMTGPGQKRSFSDISEASHGMLIDGGSLSGMHPCGGQGNLHDSPINGQRKKHFAPRASYQDSGPSQSISMPATPVRSSNENPESLLELMPSELLIRIICHLQHDQLRPPFFVCKRLREAVMVARAFHFNYTTPDHSRRDISYARLLRASQSVSLTSMEAAVIAARAAEATGSGILVIPSAPRQPPRPPEARPLHAEMRRIAAPLFPTTPRARNVSRPPGLPRAPIGTGSHRALFSVTEEELCRTMENQSI